MIPLSPSSFLCSLLLLYLVLLLLPLPCSFSRPHSSLFLSSSSFLLSSLFLHLALVLQNYDFYLKTIVIFMKEVFLPFHLFENRLPGLEIIFDFVFIEFCGLLFVLWLIWEIKKPEKTKKRLIAIVFVFAFLLLLNWLQTHSFQKSTNASEYIPPSSFSNSVPSTHPKDEVERRREEVRFEKNDEIIIGGRRMKWKEENENSRKRGEEEGRKIDEEEEERGNDDETKEKDQGKEGIDWIGLLGDFLEFLLEVLA